MSDPQVKIDDVSLDNGSWRRIVGNPAVLSDGAGLVREFAIEFLIMGDTAAELDSRLEDTWNDFSQLNPRMRMWFDSSKVLPSFDWHTGDGIHVDMVSTVTMMPEESQTQKKLHCRLVVTATTQLPLSSSTPNATGQEIEGLVSKLAVAKLYMESERYTISAQGTFASTLNESAEGPYDLASVANNSGKARFTLESPDVVVATFDQGMFIDVSSPSAYEGRHFITAISGGGAILDTSTDYVSAEGDVNASVLLGTTDTAEDNFQAGRSLILENILGTGDDGSPNATAPHFTKLGETITYSSERKDTLDFVLTAGPASMTTGITAQSGNNVDRGLSFAVTFVPPEMWDIRHATPVWLVQAEGKLAIAEEARTEDEIYSWWEQIKPTVIAQIEAVVAGRVMAGLREKQTTIAIDYTTNDITFNIGFFGNFTGTIAFSLTESVTDKQPRTIWRDTEGNNPTQSPKGPMDRTKTIRVTWLGESGAEPAIPNPPVESGFKYLFDSSQTVTQDSLTNPDTGFTYKSITRDYVFLRIKPVQAGGGAGAAGGPPTSGGRIHGDGTGRGLGDAGHAGQFG